MKRKFRVVKADIPDELIWEEFWEDKTHQDKLNATERIRTQSYFPGEGKNVKQGLQRIFRVAKRV